MKEAALQYLNMRSHSRKELKTKLLAKGKEPDAINQALDRLGAAVSAGLGVGWGRHASITSEHLTMMSLCQSNASVQGPRDTSPSTDVVTFLRFLVK